MSFSKSADVGAETIAIQTPTPTQPIPKTLMPEYDTYRADEMKPMEYGVALVRTLDDLHKVIAIRSAAYFTDPEHSFGKHFDGNDLSSSHMVGYVGEEPVGTLRIRYFADFARIERIAVRPTHRKSRISFKLVQAAVAFCRDKGYRKISGVAREEMVPFWSMFGGRLTSTKEPIFIYGLPHLEMNIEYPEVATAITQDSDTLIILRQEGRWHEPGAYRMAPGQSEPALATMPKLEPKTTPRQLAERLAAKKRALGGKPAITDATAPSETNAVAGSTDGTIIQ